MQKRTTCPRCSTNGIIKFDLDRRILLFICMLGACNFTCRPKDLRFYTNHYKNETNRNNQRN
jgi:hypothetical protein